MREMCLGCYERVDYSIEVEFHLGVEAIEGFGRPRGEQGVEIRHMHYLPLQVQGDCFGSRVDERLDVDRSGRFGVHLHGRLHAKLNGMDSQRSEGAHCFCRRELVGLSDMRLLDLEMANGRASK